MQETRKHLLDRFQEHVYKNFEAYCERHCFKNTKAGLITYLIDHELISAGQLQRYTIIKEYEQLHSEAIFQKTQVVGMLAHRFHLSERTVWSILKRVGSRTEHAGTDSGGDKKKIGNR
ncbi:MAG: hypothetical protein ACKV1O_28420 [Saprospiraceae bacterium]